MDELRIGQRNPVLDRQRNVRNAILYMFNRTAQMFEYDGLPPTIPKIALERLLQSTGIAIIAKPPNGAKPNGLGIDFDYASLADREGSDDIYAFWGTFGQAPDPYLAPHTAIVANPGFTPTISKEYEINKDCVVIRNDNQMLGVLPMYRKYAWQMADAEISLRSALINLREQRVIMASSDDAYASVQQYLERLEAGELAAVMDEPLLGNSQVYGAEGRANAVIQAIEALQYIKANWFNEMGLNAAFNMKRQYVSDEEIAANSDILLPLVDDMLECRKIGVESVNKMFGTNITVQKNSAWYNKDMDRANELTEDGDGEVTRVTESDGESNAE